MERTESVPNPDFRELFEKIPDCCLILDAHAPDFTIVAVSDEYLRATKTIRGEILGRKLFEVFPDNPDDHKADGVKNLTASLHRVLVNKVSDLMAIQKYDIPRPKTDGGGFEERYWSPENSPLFNEKGEVQYIYHHVTDVTGQERLLRQFGSSTNTQSHEGAAVTQLQRLTDLLVGREIAMAGLKEEIAQLKKAGKSS